METGLNSCFIVRFEFHNKFELKAGINTEAQYSAITDSDDPFKDLQESLDALKAADPDMAPGEVRRQDLGCLLPSTGTAR